ncbi:MAG TPA: transposase [Daejeonella sp.]|nr:transposase [Daejeonella sp.]
MPFNPNIYHRRSIRLKGYDYSQPGLYFLTLCCQNRECLLGKIEDHQMILNEAGNMVQQWYNELPHKFQNIRCHEMVVMPNHFHCIIEIIGERLPGKDSVENDLVENDLIGFDLVGGDLVGVDLRVDPSTANQERIDSAGADLQANPIAANQYRSPPICPPPVGIQVVMQWFKIMTTNSYIQGVKNCGWTRFKDKFWQRDYFEHIIRNERSYHRIAEYIMNNPGSWEDDRLR